MCLGAPCPLSPTEEHLDGFHYLTAVNSAIINMGLQVLLCCVDSGDFVYIYLEVLYLCHRARQCHIKKKKREKLTLSIVSSRVSLLD